MNESRAPLPLEALALFANAVIALLLCGLTSAAEPASAPTSPRLALVTGRAPDALVALAEVRLAEAGDVRLVERGEIERVLAEQKLSIAGVVAADQAVALGVLLHAGARAIGARGRVSRASNTKTANSTAALSTPSARPTPSLPPLGPAAFSRTSRGRTARFMAATPMRICWSLTAISKT